MEPLRAGDPRQVGEYLLLRRLGAGGMGEVYLGRSPGGRTVAVKMVRGEYAADREFRLRFRQEVSAARRVGGRWTAPVLAADTEGDHPWVATGYVAGPPLSSAVREFGPLPAPVVRALGAGLAETLEHVHGMGLVHRDIKPSNVLLALDGPRLIDFGIARALDAATALTQSGFVVGSPGFMSPEQAQGRPAGPPGDVFALGAVLAYASTGIAPFGEGVSAAVLLYRVLHEPPELGELDGDLRALILDCLAKAPADRPTPAALRERLRAGEGGTVRLGRSGWLPAAVSESVARLAVDLLSLDLDGAESDGPHGPHGPGGADGDQGPAGDGGSAGGATPPAQADGADGRTPTAPGTVRAVGDPAPATADAAHPGGTGGVAAATADVAVAPVHAARRWAAPVAAGVAVVLATAGLTLWLSGFPAGGSPGAAPEASRSASPSASPSPSPSPSPSRTVQPIAEGAVPAVFLGTWEGTVVPSRGKGSGNSLTYRVQLFQGRIGETVSRATTALPSASITCGGGTGILVSATSDTLVVSESWPASSNGCNGLVGVEVALKLNPDGSVTCSQDGFKPGRLTRAH
ncbi:hypothetical protein KNE206_64940 [Kitasatospora sp. NE20-6]|uniref:serine/threonine-protein kinase n=1 Tax=Kitasatospora sp. NE20-6 TaxID=2859066 RepID=UPI0034DBC884